MPVLSGLKTLILGASPETRAERKLLTKIDTFVLSFLCLVYWSNYLNRSNLQFAYVSGMKESIGLQGNDYTLATTVFYVGYTVGQIPHSFAIQYLPARIWFPLMGATWGTLSCILSTIKTPGQLYAIRFIQALAESSTFSGAHWLLGSWYKDSELGKRSALFACFAQIGSLFSGFMQGAIYTSLDGKLGKEGWQWTFIIDGLIALLIALYGLIIFPNTPQTTSAFYLTPEEQLLARTRLVPRPRAKFTKKEVKRIFVGWRYWMFSALFVVTSQLEAYGTNGIISIWLTTDHIAGPPKNSYYALGLIAIAIATTILAGLATDKWGQRWRVNLFMGVMLLISAIMLLVWDIPLGAKYFAFYLGGCGYAGQGTNFAWANEASRSDLERSFILYSMNLWSNAVTAWWILIFWPVSSAPRYRRGMISTIPISLVSMLLGWGTHIVDERVRRKAVKGGVDETGAGDGLTRDEDEREERRSKKSDER
ncbi:Pantothenate transporter liz1 OS=Schizosaccharomyces pombe (strain 972 / ATCC 24843) GN=liz1 PE=2 SV=2 [Rhizoctonia solani AG-1 IB]|uniref:Pantothenate transporter liz1 n=1 Tax=Thanatephorus cucumeris (strain AG1-IB / isolate 7/3/14) TaxID=1108050 RepID=A0A0B7FAY1_THACB|nr:Pantothenate transporter liz1 OS=Schizosaccharomyces pombe (strain 972 / ATCC 24843) GN=liz1 PE=2 SV=2 [Rhizoctonia solani AG-1 IB]